MQPVEKGRRYTSDEFLAMTGLPECCELLDGIIYVNGKVYDYYTSSAPVQMSAAPNQRHQRIVGGIYRRIADHIDAHNGKCEVFISPSDVRLNDEDIVQPDVFVVCDPEKLDGQYCNGAPDWVIEVLSPSDENRDTVKKLYKYSDAGVREYWIISPEDERVIVYPFGTTKVTGLFTFDDNVPAGIYKDSPDPLTICVASLLNKK